MLSTFTLSFSWPDSHWRCKYNGICHFNVIDFSPSFIGVSTDPRGICSVSSELSIPWSTSFINQSHLHKGNSKDNFFKPQKYVFEGIIHTNTQTCPLYWPDPKQKWQVFHPWDHGITLNLLSRYQQFWRGIKDRHSLRSYPGYLHQSYNHCKSVNLQEKCRECVLSPVKQFSISPSPTLHRDSIVKSMNEIIKHSPFLIIVCLYAG